MSACCDDVRSVVPVKLLLRTYSSSEKKTGVFSLRKFVGCPCDSLATVLELTRGERPYNLQSFRCLLALEWGFEATADLSETLHLGIRVMDIVKSVVLKDRYNSEWCKPVFIKTTR